MLAIVEQVKQAWPAPYRTVCRELGVPRSSLLRWKSHRQAGVAVVGRPGPAKVEPLNLAGLYDEILALAHGPQRTHGTGPLYGRHRAEISRRDFQALVEAARRELREEAQALERRVDWLVPGAVWSMDDTKKHWLGPDPDSPERSGRGRDFGHLHLVMELACRFNLRALGAAEQADGEQVAGSLRTLIGQYGPPLFLKMDGGSNFHHHAVRRLLSECGVIPLVSPPYYPPYNGGIERQHQVVLQRLGGLLRDRPVSASELVWACGVAGHEVNHIRRRSLGDRTACAALASGRPLLSQFGRREREEVYEHIKELAVDIAGELGEHTARSAETAFRYAAETWMQSNNMIRVTCQGEVLPCFYSFRSH